MGSGAMRSTRFALAAVMALAVVTPSQAVDLAPLSPQPPDVPWPTETWPTAPLPPGTDTAAIDQAMAEAFETEEPAFGRTSATLVIQGGELVLERYGEGFDADRRVPSWSMAKSITQAIAGVAVLQGLVSIDDPMGNRRWPETDPRATVAWHQWLNMVDGQAFLEIGAVLPSRNDAGKMLFGEGRLDVAGYAADLPLEHDPGTTWNYNSAGINLITDALTERIAGTDASADERREAMRSWMQQGLLTPLGMESAMPEFDAAGTFVGSSFFYATPRDFARFGLLYLRDGIWDGTRILPEGWVDFARTPGPAGNMKGYGAGWWIGLGRPPIGEDADADGPVPSIFRASGRGGQAIVIVPEKDLVLVHLGNNEGGISNRALGEWMARVIDAFPG